MKTSRWVPVGRITRTHGVRGAVVIAAYGETLGECNADERLFVCSETVSIPRPLTVEEIRPHGRQWRVRFREVKSREAAESLVGLEIGVPEEQLPPLEEGEYYYYQLIGLKVETAAGRLLGTLQGIMEGPGHDVYVVVDEHGREWLLPAVSDVIRTIDLEGGRLVVDPPAGLIDDL